MEVEEIAPPESNLAAPTANACVPHTDILIENAIDHLTEALAAFCFERLEKNVTARDTNNRVDEGIDMAALEDELRVREVSAV
jgi:hypothetical protein